MVLVLSWLFVVLDVNGRRRFMIERGYGVLEAECCSGKNVDQQAEASATKYGASTAMFILLKELELNRVTRLVPG